MLPSSGPIVPNRHKSPVTVMALRAWAFKGSPVNALAGRELAAFLGLTPREHSSGHNRRLGRITKRGNSYLRMMLIHGARSALRAGSTADVPDDLRTWALSIAQRRGFNVAAVALANKLARVCWRVWRDQRPFQRREMRARSPYRSERQEPGGPCLTTLGFCCRTTMPTRSASRQASAPDLSAYSVASKPLLG